MSNFESILDNCKVYGMMDDDTDYVYSVKRLREFLDCDELIQEHLYAFYSDRDHWMDFAFFEFIAVDDNDVYVDLVWRGCGSSALRECRHSFFGREDNPGYIFYVNRSHFEEYFDWLNKYFDMD